MDWSNESYVRLYTRDTTTWKLLGWHGQNLLMQLIRKVDRAGTMDVGRLELWQAAVLHVGAPESDAKNGAERLLTEGVVAIHGGRLVFPNYIEAQECTKSDKLRAKEYRLKRALESRVDGDTQSHDVMRESRAVTSTSLDVTVASQVDHGRHDPSRTVTDRHSLLCSAVPCSGSAVPCSAQEELAGAPAAQGDPAGTAHVIPADSETAPAATLEPLSPTGATNPPTCPSRRLLGGKARDSSPSPKSAEAWQAYAAAYQARYETPPVRNARVNAQMAQFVARVAADEAPGIAEHYLRSQNSRYLASGHSVGCLLQDAEKLRTEWVTGKHSTAHAARTADRNTGRGQAYQEMIERLRLEDEADARRLSNGH